MLAVCVSAGGCGAPDRPDPTIGSDTVADAGGAGLVAGGRPGSPEPGAAEPPAGAVDPVDPVDPGLAALTGVIVAEATTDRIVARTAPDDDARPVAALTHPTSVGGPLVLQAVDPVHRADRDWIEVLLPVRPNGTTGWVRTEHVTLSRNPYRIEIDTSDHALRVYRDRELRWETTVAIGTGATPTPIGSFYVIELLRPPTPDGPYGPFAFGLSGFSETLTEFAGGDGVIGIHGTDEPSSLGRDVSHGCVRVDNAVITEMAAELPLGTPVTITG